MAVISANNLSALDARLRRMFLEAKGNVPIISTNFTKVQTTTRRYENFNRWVGVGEASVVAEGANYPEKQISQATATTVTVQKFGFKINVTRELIEDNLFEPIADDVAKAMKNSMVSTRERRTMNLLNNGFTTQVIDDGLSLFNTAHTLIQGGTQSNRAATAAALDLDTLWSGINTMQTSVSNSGLLDSIYQPKCIVGPQDLERRMNELIKSEWVPQVTENTANVVAALYPIKAYASPYLTSTTAWFLFASPSDVVEYGIIVLMREPLQIIRDFEEMGNTELGDSVSRDIFGWKCRERYETATPKSFLGTYGNAGA